MAFLFDIEGLDLKTAFPWRMILDQLVCINRILDTVDVEPAQMEVARRKGDDN